MAKWRCTVCGYVHEGEEAPARCPVCGADRSKFERLDGTDSSSNDSPSASDDDTLKAEPERWQCAVCGYIHSGAEPPDPCPVCGAESRQFTGLEASPVSISSTSSTSAGTVADDQRWRCTVCGYIHIGPEPPEICPVCGADRSKFELLEDAAETTATEDEKPATGHQAQSEPQNPNEPPIDVLEADDSMTQDWRREWAKRKAMNQRLAELSHKNRVAMGLVDEKHNTADLTATEAWHLVKWYDAKRNELGEQMQF